METVSIEKFEIAKNLEKEKPPKDTKFIISLLIPALVIFALIILVPIVLGIFLSFREEFPLSDPLGQRFTLDNYFDLLGWWNIRSRAFWRYTYQTLFFSIVSLILEFGLGILFAMILNKKFKGRGIARATLLIPWAIPTVASATLFRFEILNNAEEFGLVNGLIELFGGQPIYFFGSGLAPTVMNLPALYPFPPFLFEIPITLTMFSAIIIDVWKTTPFITLLILAALQIVPDDLNQAGDIAGASGWQKFRYITWPLIKAGVGVALIFRMMQALRVYDAIAVLNDQSVYSMTYQAYLYWSNTDYGLSSAISIMILLFIVLFAVIILLFTSREKVVIPKLSFRKLFKRKVPLTIDSNDNNRTNLERLDKSLKQSQILTKTKESQAFSYLVGKSIKLKPISTAKVRWYIVKRRLKKILFIGLVVFMCFFCAAPFLWIFLRSFRDPRLAPNITQTHFEFWETLSFGLYPLLITIIFGVILGIVISRVRSKKIKWISSPIIVISWFIILILPYRFNVLNNIMESLTGQPWRFSFLAYEIVFQQENYFLKALLNSFMVAGLTVILVLIIGALIAYAIAKFDFPLKTGLNGFIFSMNSLPGLIIIIPFYQWILSLANILPPIQTVLDDAPQFGLILPYTAINLPLAIFILIAFFKEIPEDLWKAAKVDGASNFQIFRKVILPLTIPGIFTCAILVFIASWNELLFATVFLTGSEGSHTIPLAILTYTRNPGSITAPWDTDIALMAATSLATIPLIVVVLLFQKKIISGLTRGAVKG
ncbi:MAG: ABC transporter permease subunit [Candidatus Odinarchaeota archaeon]